MTKKKLDNLRKQAQKILASGNYDVASLPQKNIQELLYELSTYQIELEMQNAELQQSHEELQRSQKGYSDLYDFAPVGYLSLSNKNLISKVNLTASIMLGVQRSSLLKQPISTFIFSEDQDIFYSHRKQLLETQEEQTCELRLLKLDGDLIHVQFVSVINQDIDGNSGQFRTTIIDITENKLAEIIQHKTYEELQLKTLHLQESNTALKVLMDQRSKDKEHLETEMLFKVKKLLLPYVERAQELSSNITQKTSLEIIEKNLHEIIEPFAPLLSKDISKLTPSEIKITDLIKHGKSNKEISAFLNLSPSTITTHRQRIRKKLGLTNTKVNLQSLLNSQ